MKRVYCLYRVSSNIQLDEQDIPMQRIACHAFADCRGWEITKEFSEKGVSGYNHATAFFLFPFLSLADIAFEVFGLFKDMYKLPELRIRQLVIIDTQPLAVKRSLSFKRASLEICNIL